MRAQKIVPQLPPNSAPHIIERLIEIGLTEAAGMGVAPISWQSINAWRQLTGVDLPPWEARLLRALSVAYVAEGRAAEAETCPPPWVASATGSVIEAELRVLDAVLG